MDVDDMRKKRFEFLRKLYELSGGDQLKWFNMQEIGNPLRFKRDLAEKVGMYLKEERLIKFHTCEPNIGITHWGVKVVEEALSNPEKSTDYFPPVNIISTGDIVNSQIQVQSVGAKQTMESKIPEYEKLEVALDQIQASLDKLELNAEQRSDMAGHIGTIRVQMSLYEPKVGIIRECVSSIRHILEGIAGSVLASGLLQKIQAAFPG